MKFMKVSLAVLALVGGIDAMNIRLQQGMGSDVKADTNADHRVEAGRFINSKGESIILAETKGHARI